MVDNNNMGGDDYRFDNIDSSNNAFNGDNSDFGGGGGSREYNGGGFEFDGGRGGVKRKSYLKPKFQFHFN